jgi:hypothetical protein
VPFAEKVNVSIRDDVVSSGESGIVGAAPATEKASTPEARTLIPLITFDVMMFS